MTAVRFKLAKSLRDSRDNGPRNRWQRFAQCSGQFVFLEQAGQMRTAQLNKKIEKTRISVLVEVKQRFVDGAPVVTSVLEHSSGRSDFAAQSLFTDDLPRIAGQIQICADPL